MKQRRCVKVLNTPAVTCIATAVAGAGIAIDTARRGATAQNPVANARDVRAALRASWIAPRPRRPSVRHEPLL
jgi:hypothetical protein